MTARQRQLLALYLGAICVLATATIVVALVAPLPPFDWAWWGAACLFATMVLTESAAVPVPVNTTTDRTYIVSIATVPHIAAALLLPPFLAGSLAGVAMLVDELRSKRPIQRLVFNVASTTTTVTAVGLGASSFGLHGGQLGNGDPRQLPAFLVVIAAYYVINAVLIAAAGALSSARSFRGELVSNARFTAPAEMVVAALGGVTAFMWAKDAFWLPIGLSPVLIAQLTLRSIAAGNRKTTRLVSLDRLGRDLSACLTADEVLSTARDHLLGNLRLEGYVLRVSTPEVECAEGLAASGSSVAFAEQLGEEVVASRKQAYSREARRPEPPSQEANVAARNWLAIPLLLGDDVRGYLAVVSSGAHGFGDEDQQFLPLVVDRISLALENARRAAELSRMAFHDPLTNLPNRTLLLDRVAHALARTGRTGRSAAVLFLDLDNFKVINDSLGHQAGDALLIEVAQRLSSSVREDDTVARLGGDEFTILLEDVASEAEAIEAAERVAQALQAPILLDSHELRVTASIGIVVSNSAEHKSSEGFLRAADVAMYCAKVQGKSGYAVFEPSMEQQAVDRLEIEIALRQAMERGEFRLHYQPIVRLEDGRITEVEALIRWVRPGHGVVSPVSFIPIAEETGLIVPIGQWVLKEACHQAVAWHARSSEDPLVISVNLSARQLQQPNFVTVVRQVLRETGLNPRTLKLEITESALMEDAEAAAATMRTLKELGIRFAIDDFGTGYSSLSYLKRFPLDTLKIDRSFVDGLGEDSQDTAIVQGIVALARALKLSVTAEGIEAVEQHAQLRQLGCDHGQGYLFAKPVTAERIAALLEVSGLADQHLRRAA